MNLERRKQSLLSHFRSPPYASTKHLLLNMSLLSLSVFQFEECARLEPDLSLFTLALVRVNRIECV